VVGAAAGGSVHGGGGGGAHWRVFVSLWDLEMGDRYILASIVQGGGVQKCLAVLAFFFFFFFNSWNF
jgi:hypothetical protein